MIVTRNDSWLQKTLYLIIAVLGLYIVYKSGTILLKNRQARPVSGSGELQRDVEDTAVRTLLPGYAAALEGKGKEGWLAGFMEPLAPIYSYMIQHPGNADETDSLQEADAGQAEAETDQEAGQAGTETGRKANAGQTGEETNTRQAKAGTAREADGADGSETSGAENGNRPDDFDDDEALDDAPAPSEDGAASDEVPDEQTMEVFGRRNGISLSLLKQLQDFDYLLSGYYTLDAGTTIDGSLLDAQALLSKDLSIRKNADEPQILIYHTHSQEGFADSVEGDVSTTIVGMGEVLAELLRSRYGYQVIHDTGVYDLVDGILDRSAAYDYAREAVERILAENPTIEVVIDLHRDGVDGYKFVTEIDGKPASKIMFFNGLSQDENGEPLTWLENPYLEDNLAFSLQLQLLARQQYPDFTRNIYLKAERFNLHLRARSLLIEAGTQLNTVEEERNAMEPLAALLAQVLEGS